MAAATAVVTAIVLHGATEASVTHWSTYWQTLHSSPHTARVFSCGTVAGETVPVAGDAVSELTGALTSAMSWLMEAAPAESAPSPADGGGHFQDAQDSQKSLHLVVVAVGGATTDAVRPYTCGGAADVRVALARAAARALAGNPAGVGAPPVHAHVFVRGAVTPSNSLETSKDSIETSTNSNRRWRLSLALPRLTGEWTASADGRPRALETLATAAMMAALDAVFVAVALAGQPAPRVFLCMRRSLLTCAGADRPGLNMLSLVEAQSRVVKPDPSQPQSNSNSNSQIQAADQSSLPMFVPDPASTRIHLRPWSTNGSIAALEAGAVALLHVRGKTASSPVLCAAFDPESGVYLCTPMPRPEPSILDGTAVAPATSLTMVTHESLDPASKKRKRDMDPEDDAPDNPAKHKPDPPIKHEPSIATDAVPTADPATSATEPTNQNAWKDMERFDNMTHRERQELAGEVAMQNETTAAGATRPPPRRIHPSYLVVPAPLAESKKSHANHRDAYLPGTFGHLWLNVLAPELTPKQRDFDGRAFGMNHASVSAKNTT